MMNTLQFITTLATIIISLFGAAAFLGWQTGQLIAQIDKRFEQMERRLDLMERRAEERSGQTEKRFDERLAGLEARMDLLERNLTARFEDLKAFVLRTA
jgi:hypothetical protein